MARKTVLVVDDDMNIVRLVRAYLERDGYKVLEAFDGSTALELARKANPHLVVLDLMLPKVDGLEVCRILRKETDVPVIMLTAKTTEQDKLVGLDLGADDYVTKPFSPRELVARVRAVLRRTPNLQEYQGPSQLSFGELHIDFNKYQVSVRGREARLTPTEFRVLAILVGSPGRVFTRDELITKAFGIEFEGFDRNVDVHIVNLRRKIEPDPASPRYLKTVFGVGYKFEGRAPCPRGGSDGE